MTTHAKTIIFVVGVLLGIVVGEKSIFSSEVGICAMTLLVIQGGLYIWERKRKQLSEAVGLAHQISFPLITILFCLGLFIGVVRVQLVEEKINFVCEQSCVLDGTIVTSPETKNEYQIYSVQPITESGEVYDVLVRVPLYPRYEIGETLKLSGKVTVPKIIYPHDDKNNDKGFDYASYLRTKNIGSEMIYPHVEVLDSEAHTTRDVLGRLKENLISRIENYVSAPASSLASGMLFGASSMSKELMQTFRTAGLSHIVVLSGFNIVILISSVLFVLTFLPIALRVVIATAFVILFVIMVGGEPSVIRATLMALISLVAILLGRVYVARQALVLSLFVIVMYEPYSLMHDVSLHLSFLATVGLVYMSRPLELLFKESFLEKVSLLREISITTISAYFATLPYVMYTFGTVSVYALIANILVVPFVPLAMLLSFLVVVGSYISETLSLLIGFMNSFLINCMIGIARIVEVLPYSTITFSVSFQAMCFAYFIVLMAVLIIVRKNSNETRATTEKGNLTDIISY